MTETQVWMIILMVSNQLTSIRSEYSRDGVHSCVMLVSLVFLAISFLKSAAEGAQRLSIWWMS